MGGTAGVGAPFIGLCLAVRQSSDSDVCPGKPEEESGSAAVCLGVRHMAGSRYVLGFLVRAVGRTVFTWPLDEQVGYDETLFGD